MIRGKIMKKPYVFLAMITAIAICFATMPFFFLGAPLPLFSIDNKDVIEHKAVIEMFDSTNKSLLKEAYELTPDKSITRSKPTWLSLKLSFPPGRTEEYTIKVTLDDNLTNKFQMDLGLWNSFDIILYNYSSEYPLVIREITV
ncbi:hypothetical protein Mpsy_1391 [Methanolobus psychrophilus R15]|nr:hypothetical protein Mpsy_1391 [Methanolobus psychrophilus R15]